MCKLYNIKLILCNSTILPLNHLCHLKFQVCLNYQITHSAITKEKILNNLIKQFYEKNNTINL